MEISPDNQYINKFDNLDKLYKASITTTSLAESGISAQEKRFPLEEELGEYQKAFNKNASSAICKYMASMKSMEERDNCKMVNHSTKRNCMASQPTTAEFLHNTKEKYQKVINLPDHRIPTIHFVMGNESADMDSIISSIAYAYFLNQKSSNKEAIYIPLLNIRKEDINLRKDTLYLFKLLNISTQDLLFLDDNIPLDTLFNQDKLRLNLVDHNTLRPSLEHLCNAVESIIDHHTDEHKNYPLIDKNNSLIATVGPATTLIAEKIINSRTMTLTPELAALLLGPILFDTANLQAIEKTTQRDRQAVESLYPIAASLLSHDYYEKLLNARNDVSGLSVEMLLNKDFKEYLDGELLYGIASLPATVYWEQSNEKILAPDLEKFAKEHKLAFLVILMNNPNPNPNEHNRKIIVYSPTPKLLSAFESYIRSDSILSQELGNAAISNMENMAYYTTKQFISRKQLQPLFDFSQNKDILSAFEEIKKLTKSNFE
jgi:exopolyphosphatase